MRVRRMHTPVRDQYVIAKIKEAVASGARDIAPADICTFYKRVTVVKERERERERE